MHLLRAIAIVACLAPAAHAGITHHGTTGQTLYARVQIGDASFESVAITEGTNGGLAVYSVTDAALVSAGVTTPGDLPYTIRTGSPSDTANDPIVGSGVLHWTGASELVRAATWNRVWYVDDGGSDSNSGLTPSAAKATIAAAHTLASPGDTIHIAAGTYSGALALSKHGITYLGESASTVTITHSSSYTVTLTGNHCTLRNLNIVASAETSGGTALTVASTVATTVEGCTINGKFDGLYTDGALRLTLRRCNVLGTYDAANFANVRQLRCEDTIFTSSANHSTDAEFRSVIIIDSSASTLLLATSQHEFINCDFRISRSGTSAGGYATVAVRAAGLASFENCRFSARATSASYTGNVNGIIGEGLFGLTPFYAGHIKLKGGYVRTSKNEDATGTLTDLLTTVSEAEIHTDGAVYASASGNVYNDSPTAALVNSAVVAGTVGTNVTAILDDTGTSGVQIAAGEVDSTAVADGAIDAGAFAADAITAAKLASDVTTELQTGLATASALSSVAASATTAATQSTTAATQTAASAIRSALGLTSANLDTQLDTLPTASEVTTALLDTTTTDPGPGTVGRALHYLRTAWASAGVFSEAALAEAPSGGGGGVTAVSADVVDDSRTWVAIGRAAGNIIEVEDTSGELTFALRPKLNPGTTINTVSAVTITGAATVTATDLTVDRSRTKAHFSVASLTTAGTYTVRVTVTTSDSQTIVTTATLKVR